MAKNHFMDLLLVRARAYATAHGIAMATASTRAFNDGKVLKRIEWHGADLTTRRYESAMRFFGQPPSGRQLSTFPKDRRGSLSA